MTRRDRGSPEGYDIYLVNYKTKETKQLTDGWKYEQAPVIVKIKK